MKPQCLFCHTDLIGEDSEDQFLSCLVCKTFYSVDDNGLDSYIMYCDDYSVCVDLRNHQLLVRKKDEGYITLWKRVLELDCITHGLTPFNLQDKIKMLLLFS